MTNAILACFLAAIPAGLHPVTQARAEAHLAGRDMTAVLACLIAAVPVDVHPLVYKRAIDRASVVASLWPPELNVGVGCDFEEMLWKESGYHADARGRLGEAGLGQILGTSGRAYCRGLRWRTDPADNLRCAARIWVRAGRRHCRYRGACVRGSKP